MIILYSCSGRVKQHTFNRPEEIIKMKKLAIAPFHNLTQKLDAGVIMNHMIMAELIKNRTIKIIKYGDVYEALLKEHINAPATLDRATLRMLRDTLKVDGVLVGTLIIYKEDPEGTEIRFDATLLDTDDGTIVWKGEFHKSGNTYSPSHLFQKTDSQMILALAQRIAIELVDTLSLNMSP